MYQPSGVELRTAHAEALPIATSHGPTGTHTHIARGHALVNTRRGGRARARGGIVVRGHVARARRALHVGCRHGGGERAEHRGGAVMIVTEIEQNKLVLRRDVSAFNEK